MGRRRGRVERGLSELLARGLTATCVFALTDVMAIGACAALRDHGAGDAQARSVSGCASTSA
ncbi:hypothetical protein [Micromonospora kangleipakensis]|uniref:hypothetical protein n=1 Tax=Micromonospora kangleipakensis TaxID=1077942 RepID=UPI001F5E8BB1|nr:hypothetical protein [Micromonospora kangleipakensis]